MAGEEEEKSGGHNDREDPDPTASTDDADRLEEDADCGGEMDDGACGDSEMLPLPFTDATPIHHSHSDGDSNLSCSSNSAQVPTARGSSLSDLASVAMTDSSMEAALLSSSASASASAPPPAAFGLLRVDSAQRRLTISDKRATELEFAALHGQHVCSTRRAVMGAYTYRGWLRGQQRRGVGQTTYDSGAVFVGEYRDDKCNGLHLDWEAGSRSGLPCDCSIGSLLCLPHCHCRCCFRSRAGQGKWTCRDSDGNLQTYEGEWKDDAEHGAGKVSRLSLSGRLVWFGGQPVVAWSSRYLIFSRSFFCQVYLRGLAAGFGPLQRSFRGRGTARRRLRVAAGVGPRVFQRTHGAGTVQIWSEASTSKQWTCDGPLNGKAELTLCSAAWSFGRFGFVRPAGLPAQFGRLRRRPDRRRDQRSEYRHCRRSAGRVASSCVH